MKKVFIASRFSEFREIREKLTQELKDIALIPINLDDNKAVSMSPAERSLFNVEEADIIVFLLGDTYSDNKGKSITHMEYEKSVELKKKIYIYGIGKLYANNDIQLSSNENYKNWQLELMNEKVFSKFCQNTNIDLIIQEITNNIYDIENKIWFDEETGLMWQASIDSTEEHGRLPWHEIFEYRDKLNLNNFGGFNDWRIPTFDELQTLFIQEPHSNILYSYDKETYIKKPLLRSMRMKHSRFWSGTTNEKNKDLAYGVHFGRKRENSLSKNGNKEKYKTRFVRCVRLWQYSEIKFAWEQVKDSTLIQDLEEFKKKFPASKYETLIDEKIIALNKLHKDYLNSLSLYGRKKLEFEKTYASYSHGIFLKAIQEGFFDECTLDALNELKENMKQTKDWKVVSTARNSDKDKKYKKTQEVINLLKSHGEK